MYPEAIQNLIKHFSRLPSVGPKTAERYVFYLLNSHSEELQKFAQSIAELKEKTTTCLSCYNISNESPCAICRDQRRKHDMLCVVATSRDLNSIENSKIFTGVYHVLGGQINTIEGIKPEQLKIKELLERIKAGRFQEIIFALGPNIEGETTALYLKKIITPFNIRITRIARGLPAGAELEYADEITIANALKFRNDL